MSNSLGKRAYSEGLTFREAVTSLVGDDELEFDDVICVLRALAEFLFTFVFFTLSMDEYVMAAVVVHTISQYMRIVRNGLETNRRVCDH